MKLISINPENNTERENYKLLIGSVIPRPIAFVTTISGSGTVNGAPFSYFSVVSSNPPLVSISIQRKDGEKKDTARNAIASKEFVVHIVDEQNVGKINQTAASLPPDQSEIQAAQLTLAPSLTIATPGIKEAKVRMECTLEYAHEFDGCDLLIGRVVQFHVAEEIYEDGKINPRGLGAVSRLAGQDYATIGNIFSIERPK